MSDIDDFFESRDLPYRATSMSQLFGSIDSRGPQHVVVAEVADPKGGKPKFYLGYHGHSDAKVVEKHLRRVRKYKVNRVMVVSPEPEVRYV